MQKIIKRNTRLRFVRKQAIEVKSEMPIVMEREEAPVRELIGGSVPHRKKRRSVRKKKSKTGKILRIILNVLLCTALAISIVFNVFQYLNEKQFGNETAGLKTKVEQLTKTVENHEKTIKEQEQTIGDQKTTISEQKSAITEYVAETEALKADNARLKFYEKNAVIVPNNDTQHYHKYGCSKLNISSGYWIYNTSAAAAQDYSPCPLCIK